LQRRSFLAGSVLVACSGASQKVVKSEAHEAEEEVTPAEDLMREHGVLRRVMFLYDEAALRLDAKGAVPLDAVGACAAIVRRVIEDYHEKLEEQFLFPRYEAAGKLVELVAVLRAQHVAGRVVTDRIVTLAKGSDHAGLVAALRGFNRMYRAHAGREDTVLFPALRELVGKHAYAELGEQFEEKEEQMLGAHGFEKTVEEVARLEQAFGVDDLATLTVR
jgi:hemerythrin-like domain-containing protein